ncbi:MAG: hypothetical protein J6A94_06495 [Lachnospiraceae bacterium]|nr:hypothetical protein [Lachnospiraceae bacterium]
MPRVNVQEETKIFGEKLRSGYFAQERSKNTEVNYAQEKELRDTEAVKAYTQTELFEYIKEMR